MAARNLVDQVHVVLGRYSGDESRKGWISGLEERAGYEHPTIGGLRIGKKLVERISDEPFDERLEWDRDGQYFHYLTTWIQALARIAACTGDGHYQYWALALARASHAGFTYRLEAGKSRRMYWKMSVDLSRALVASMGHHDPLDALITCLELKANNEGFEYSLSDINLEKEIFDCQAMCVARNWATDDPLGTGSLLVDTWRLEQFKTRMNISVSVDLTSLLADCESGLEALEHSGILNYPAQHRLAFREFGLSTGLHALARSNDLAQHNMSEFSSTEGRQLARLGKFSYLSICPQKS